MSAYTSCVSPSDFCLAGSVERGSTTVVGMLNNDCSTTKKRSDASDVDDDQPGDNGIHD